MLWWFRFPDNLQHGRARLKNCDGLAKPSEIQLEPLKKNRKGACLRNKQSGAGHAGRCKVVCVAPRDYFPRSTDFL